MSDKLKIDNEQLMTIVAGCLFVTSIMLVVRFSYTLGRLDGAIDAEIMAVIQTGNKAHENKGLKDGD